MEKRYKWKVITTAAEDLESALNEYAGLGYEVFKISKSSVNPISSHIPFGSFTVVFRKLVLPARNPRPNTSTEKL